MRYRVATWSLGGPAELSDWAEHSDAFAAGADVERVLLRIADEG